MRSRNRSIAREDSSQLELDVFLRKLAELHHELPERGLAESAGWISSDLTEPGHAPLFEQGNERCGRKRQIGFVISAMGV